MCVLVLVFPIGTANAQALPTLVSSASPACIQPISDRWAPSAGCGTRSSTDLPHMAIMPDSGAVRPTQWVKGAIIGGAIGAVAFGTLDFVMCGITDNPAECRHDVPAAVLLGAFMGGMTGALIGGAFPKPPPRAQDSGSGR